MNLTKINGTRRRTIFSFLANTNVCFKPFTHALKLTINEYLYIIEKKRTDLQQKKHKKTLNKNACKMLKLVIRLNLINYARRTLARFT